MVWVPSSRLTDGRSPERQYFHVTKFQVATRLSHRRDQDWVFDLDNTIYPAKSNLFLRVAVRITEFVAQHFDVPLDEARVIQTDLFRRYGTTMRGLMVEQQLAPEDYLHFVHDIDVSDLPVEHELDRLLSALPGRKHIFTNGSFRTQGTF